MNARSPGALMLVAPSDHSIPDADSFSDSVNAAVPAALNGELVAFGIRPTRAETGYGWLEIGESLSSNIGELKPQSLVSFVEKPGLTTAESMLVGNKHFWNADIFLFKTDSLIEAFEKHSPEVLATARQAFECAEKDLSFTRLDTVSWEQAPDISLDYAVMEHARNLSVVAYNGAWSDLCDWQAVWRENEPDK